MTARRLRRVETAEGTLFVPVPIYRCYYCDTLLPIEREREPLCEACESAAAQMATTTTPATTRDKPTAPETADMFPAPAGNSTTSGA